MRIFQQIPLEENTIIELDEAATHHVARVMRANVGDVLTLFNGEGGEFNSVITRIDKKTVAVEIKKFIAKNSESPLTLCLAQGISRGEKMDFTIQKAVELGVKKIIPLFTERCNVKLDEDRLLKRIEHWRAVARSACEQCGRNEIPFIDSPQKLITWLPTTHADVKFVLAPSATVRLSQHLISNNAHVVLLVGPEGGLSEIEITQAMQNEFLGLNLGPRILRTETAAVAALAALQVVAGDF